MEVAEREIQVRSFVDDVWNGRKYEAAAGLYSENYTNAFGAGPSARIEPIRRYHEAFPDLHLDVDELILTGDAAVLRMTFRGTRYGRIRRPGPYGTPRGGMGGHDHAL